jgi:hypothetical protein
VFEYEEITECPTSNGLTIIEAIAPNVIRLNAFVKKSRRFIIANRKLHFRRLWMQGTRLHYVYNVDPAG